MSACSATPQAQQGNGGTIVVATAGEPDTLNPVLNYGVDGASLIFDGLVARDAGNELVPALASALPEVSATDSLRKELALAVTADAKKLGIQVTPEGLTWDAITPRMKTDALIMGWGSPYDPDFISYKLKPS